MRYEFSQLLDFISLTVDLIMMIAVWKTIKLYVWKMVDLFERIIFYYTCDMESWVFANVWKGYANIINYLWSVERCEVKLSALMGHGSPIMHYFLICSSIVKVQNWNLQRCTFCVFYQIVFLTFFPQQYITLSYYELLFGVKRSRSYNFCQGHKCFDYVLYIVYLTWLLLKYCWKIFIYFSTFHICLQLLLNNYGMLGEREIILVLLKKLLICC